MVTVEWNRTGHESGSDTEHRPASVPKLAWGKEEKEGPGAAPAQQPEEVEQFQPPQKGAAVQRTREQERTRGRFRRTAQMVCKFMKRIREEESSVVGTVVRAYSPIFKTKTSAALLDMLVEEGPSSPKQVPAMVRYIHQWLVANEFPEYNLYRPLLDLTEAQPSDVVMALLRVAPVCDRAALAMWKSIMCTPSETNFWEEGSCDLADYPGKGQNLLDYGQEITYETRCGDTPLWTLDQRKEYNN
nr:uncharacterized protein LOC121468698 [Taeniopygia guttata]